MLGNIPARSKIFAELKSVNAKSIAIVVALDGVLNLLSSLYPAFRGRFLILLNFLPIDVIRSARLATILISFSLIILSLGLYRHKRIAWFFTLVVLFTSVFAHILKGLDFEEAAIAIILWFWLVLSGKYFHAKSDTPSVWQGIRAVAAAAIFTFVYGILGFYILDHHFGVRFNITDAVRETFKTLLTFQGPIMPHTKFGRFFIDSLYSIAFFTSLYALFMLLRPVVLRQKTSKSEYIKAEKIIQEYRANVLSKFVLLPDKYFFFSSGGSVLSYAQNGRVVIVLGGPIGPKNDIAKAVSEFASFSNQNDWRPAFYQVNEEGLKLFEEAGFDSVCIGNEALVDLENFSLEGSQIKKLRSVVKKIDELGFKTKVFNPPLSNSLLESLRVISDEWLDEKKENEKSFSLGWFDDVYIKNSSVIVLFSPNQTPCAFISLITDYSKEEFGIDLMRKTRYDENGMMEFLFVELFAWGKNQGFKYCNLGLSALAKISDQATELNISERALDFAFNYFNQLYNFKGLYNFKSKFLPVWRPKYLVFIGGAASFPSVIMALINANSGENIIISQLKELFNISRNP